MLAMAPTGTPTSRRLAMGKYFIPALLVVTIGAAVPRFIGIQADLSYDEGHYAEAARLGIVANALDMDGAFRLRHEHPPLLAHLTGAAIGLFGNRVWAIRLASFAASVLLVPLMGLLLFRLSGDERTGLLGSLLMVSMPVLAVSGRVGDHHALVIAFMLTAVVLFGRALEEGSARTLVLSGLAFGLLVATSEFGVLVAGLCLVLLLVIPNRFVSVLRPPRRLDGAVVWAGVAAIAVPIVLWPAGLFRKNLLDSLVRYSSASIESRVGANALPVPRATVYLEQYAAIAPAYLVLFLGTLMLVLAFLVLRRLPRSLQPAAWTLLFLTAVMHAQVPAAFRYSLYAATFMILFAAWFLGRFILRYPKAGVLVLSVVGAILLVTTPSALSFGLPQIGGYRSAAWFLSGVAPRGGKVLSTSPHLLAFYLEQVDPSRMESADGRPRTAFGRDGTVRTVGAWVIEEYPLGRLPPNKLEALRSGQYDWVVAERHRRWANPDDPVHEVLVPGTEIWSSQSLEPDPFGLIRFPERFGTIIYRGRFPPAGENAAVSPR
jgi:4-amino-4-deoxy-L-arabinose transferase-like glycosyltransferase